MPRSVHARCLRVLALLTLCLPAGCTQKGQSAGATGAPIIRVRLFEAQSNVTVSSTESFAFREAPGVSPRPLNVARRQPVPIARTASGWRLGDTPVDATELTLLAVGEGGHLSINGKPYRGLCRLVPVGPGTFDVINDLDLESYLKGVLANELLRDWHEEAYKAQAIVARTYALYEMKTAGVGRYWDVYPDEKSQVYKGMGSENGLSQGATDATAGIVVAYGAKGQEKIFKAYFSACCGGISQSAADAFGDRPLEPLSEQTFGNRCNISARFNWGPVVVRKDELTRRFRIWGASRNRGEKNMPGVAKIEITHVNKFGRPIRFSITDVNGQRYSLSGTELRFAINAGAQPGTTVYSSFFTPAEGDDGQTIRFVDGHGNGHGVGLCQYCAQAQAESGISHEDIVLDAYPAASLQRAY